jgi:hypothetical protein
VLGAVALNAYVLFALGFQQPRDAAWLLALDAGFTLWSTIEAAVKIRRAGWQRYIDVGWNRFDLALVVLSAPSMPL